MRMWMGHSAVSTPQASLVTLSGNMDQVKITSVKKKSTMQSIHGRVNPHRAQR